MTPLRFTWFSIGLLFLVLLPVVVNAQRVEIRFRIHPQSKSTECSKLLGLEPTADQLTEIDMDQDYKIVLDRGWVHLDRYDYDQNRRFYPCFQDLVVSFPSVSSFHAFVEEMTSCPQYPFVGSGSDYALQMTIFERAASTGDLRLYVILLSKDGRCASEMNPPLYSILRENPEALLTAFDKLNEKQKQVAVATQYDFNVALQHQIISEQQIAKLPKHLVQIARLFNDMMRREVKQQKSQVNHLLQSQTEGK